MLKRPVILVYAAMLAISASAADKYAGEFLNYGVGARALGMGGAFSAVADDSTAAYWNPAGLATLEQNEVSFMHAYAFGGLANYDTIFGCYRAGKYGTFGGGLLRLGVQDIVITEWDDPDAEDRRPIVRREVNWSDNGYFVSYGRPVWKKISLGGNFVYIRQGTADVGTSSGQVVALGVLAGPYGPFKFGVHAQNIVGRIEWSTGTTETIPFNLKFGTSYSQAITAADSELTLAFDGDMKNAGYDVGAGFNAGNLSLDIHGGAEWWYRRVVALRFGVEKRQEERTDISGGAGLRIAAAGMAFGVDYAYMGDPGIGSTHRVSASVGF
ncbi:MAG: PorV/PorQ family protein [Candidatus Coatesbacteria bacterium]|nr:MAG: PorV/PorQ family protein [Candidatus Coatesbacteria bacterium]